MYGRYDEMHDGVGWAGWLMMAILLVLLVAILVVALLALLGKIPGTRGSAGAAPSASLPSDAERLLDHRFAAGEIDEEEYRRRRGVLHGG